MKAAALLLILLALVPLSAAAQQEPRRQTTEIGRVQTASGGAILLQVTTSLAGYPSALVYVSDKHTIRTTMSSLDRAQLARLRALIDETLAELDALPTPAPR